MITRNISWGGKGGRCVGLTTLPLAGTDCLEVWEPQTPGILGGFSRPVMRFLYLLWLQYVWFIVVQHLNLENAPRVPYKNLFPYIEKKS